MGWWTIVNDVTETNPSAIKTPRIQSGNFTRLDQGDKNWSALFAVQIVLSIMIVQNPIVTIVLIAVYLLSLYHLQYSRVYYALFVDLPLNLKIRFVDKGVRYDSANNKGSIEAAMPNPTLRIFDVDETTSNGYVELSDGSGYMVGIIGSGSYAAVLDAQEQVERSNILAEQTRTSGGDFAYIYSSRLHNPWPEIDIASQTVSPRVAYVPEEPYGTTEPELRDWKRYDTLKKFLAGRQGLLQQTASNPVLMVTLTVPKNTGVVTWNRRRKNGNEGMSADKYRDIFRHAELVVEQLKHFGVTDAHIASFDEMLEHYRLSWDAEGAAEFYNDLHDSQLDRSQSEEVEGGTEEDDESVGPHYPSHLPSYVRWTKNYAQYDDNYIGAVVVTATPGELCPTDLDPLYGIVDKNKKQLQYSLVVIGANGSARLEARTLTRGTLLLESLQDLVMGEEYRELSYEARERAEESRARLSEIGESRNQQYYFNIVVTVNASSVQELDDDIKSVCDVLSGLRLKPKRVQAGERQLARVISCTVGIDTM